MHNHRYLYFSVFLLVLIVLLGLALFFLPPSVQKTEPDESQIEEISSPDPKPPDDLSFPFSPVHSSASEEKDEETSKENSLPCHSELIEPTPSRGSFGTYQNSVISLTFPSGDTLSMGVQTEDQDVLFMNPFYSFAEENSSKDHENVKIGYYLTGVSSPFSEYDLLSSSMELESFDQIQFTAENHYLITEQTFDTLLPASFHSPVRFGLAWKDADDWNGQEPTKRKVIGIRVIRLCDGCPLASAKLTIRYDAAMNRYYMDSLENTDSYSPEEDDLSDLLTARALDFTENDSKNTWILENPDRRLEKCLIEQIPMTYFPKFIDTEGRIVSRSSFFLTHVTAVTLFFSDLGPFTVYFAPKEELLGLTAESPIRTWTIFGYDPLFPYSRTTLLLPSGDLSDFFPGH